MAGATPGVRGLGSAVDEAGDDGARVLRPGAKRTRLEGAGANNSKHSLVTVHKTAVQYAPSSSSLSFLSWPSPGASLSPTEGVEAATVPTDWGRWATPTAVHRLDWSGSVCYPCRVVQGAGSG